jgi:hypothetical protein
MYIQQISSITITGDEKNIIDHKYSIINIRILNLYEYDIINSINQLECDTLNIYMLSCEYIPKILDKIKINKHLNITVLSIMTGILCTNCVLLDLTKCKSIESLNINQKFEPHQQHYKLFLNIPSNIKIITIEAYGFRCQMPQYLMTSWEMSNYEVFIVGENQDLTIENKIKEFKNKNIKICNLKCNENNYTTTTIKEINEKIQELSKPDKGKSGYERNVIYNKEYWTLDANTINPHKPTEESKAPTNSHKQPNKSTETPLNPLKPFDRSIDNKQLDQSKLSTMEIIGIITWIASIISIIIAVVNNHTVLIEKQ